MAGKDFQVGLTPDFAVDAKGKYEAFVEEKLGGVAGLAYELMPSHEAIGDYDAVLALKIKIDAAALEDVERTAVIARWGVGYDSIDTAAMTAADMALAITPNGVRRPVAEAILAYVFALSKNMLEQDRVTRGGGWRAQLERRSVCVGGRTLGSVGCGNIGQEMFRLAASLGFDRFVAHDPHINPEAAHDLGVELVSLEEVFELSDYVAVNTLLNESTRELIGAEHFRRMKPTAYFINTARGPIVREADLVAALQEGRIAGAGIDVFEQEPPGENHPLFGLDNVILSPHALAWTDEIARDNSYEACDNILAVFHGQTPPGLVNREVAERDGFRAKLARYRSRL